MWLQSSFQWDFELALVYGGSFFLAVYYDSEEVMYHAHN